MIGIIMTRKHLLQYMQSVLLRRSSALRRLLANEMDELNMSDEYTVRDDADLAVDADCGTVNSQLAEMESFELDQIEHALDRIREGRYGVCESCGAKIPIARLQALPYATKCVRCQETAEGDSAQNRLLSEFVSSG
jgi:DnaK suppressor protein